MKKLKIAQVGSIWERTPPRLYGGTERVVHSLTEELTKKGHKVTLFATGDSKTSAELKSVYPRALYRDNVPWTSFLYPFDHVSQPFLRADEFDIIHVHLNQSQDYAALVLAQFVKTPVIFTLHFQLPIPGDKSRKDRLEFLQKYRDRNFVSISDTQRTLDLNYVATVYNGLDFKSFTFDEKKPGKDLVWIGKICNHKGTYEAIQVAKRSGMNLIIAGTLDLLRKDYAEYYQTKIAPLIDGKQIKYIGEVTDAQKVALLKKAKALLMPIKWNEPFGLTVIEAMAMGVPVIAFDRGPMKDIIRQGETGFVVANIKEMAAAVKKIENLNRGLIGRYARSHFSADVMATNYLAVYEKMIKNHKHNHH
jgi:glycosyltransferase involved in cell wall biosynthesis